MKEHLVRIGGTLNNVRFVTANLVVLIRTVFVGILSAEVWRLALIAANKLNIWIISKDWYIWALLACVLYSATLVGYLLTRSVMVDCKRIIKSARFDILASFCFGIWLSVAWSGFFAGWYTNLVNVLNIKQLLTLVVAPFVLGFLIVTRSIFRKKIEVESSFVVDLELERREDDLLNFAEKANGFAERVFNGGSPKSFVFGVDAPWGIGKSTFINFCREYWKEKHLDKTVVYKFSPLRHSGSPNLLQVFIDGLIHAIQKDSFVPEVKPLVSRYSRLLKEVSRFSLFGLTFPTFTVDYTADEACDDLSVVLQRFDKKVIIIIDDLDRIGFSEIKDILFVIRKSFIFPNISYVICYDTENIGSLEAEVPDSEKISEFLEKFVNIKISLYLEREDLAKYVSENLGKAIATKLIDPLPVRQAIGGLLDIYKSSEYHKYLPFIGDVRKLKRLINTVLMFELETTDFKNSDFDKGDLIHLLLIYIHYPNVFRKNI